MTSGCLPLPATCASTRVIRLWNPGDVEIGSLHHIIDSVANRESLSKFSQQQFQLCSLQNGVKVILDALEDPGGSKVVDVVEKKIFRLDAVARVLCDGSKGVVSFDSPSLQPLEIQSVLGIAEGVNLLESRQLGMQSNDQQTHIRPSAADASGTMSIDLTATSKSVSQQPGSHGAAFHPTLTSSITSQKLKHPSNYSSSDGNFTSANIANKLIASGKERPTLSFKTTSRR